MHQQYIQIQVNRSRLTVLVPDFREFLVETSDRLDHCLHSELRSGT